MLRTPLMLLAALAATAAAPKPAVRKPAAPAAHPAAPAQAATPAGASADTTDPATIVSMASAGGAKAVVARKDADTVLVTIATASENFSMQYAGCAPDGRQCKVVVLDSQAEGTPTLAQLNGFNQSSAMCRGYQDRSNRVHVTMSMLLFPDDSRQHLLTQMAAWQGCISDFTGFARNPVAYLSAAP